MKTLFCISNLNLLRQGVYFCVLRRYGGGVVRSLLSKSNLIYIRRILWKGLGWCRLSCLCAEGKIESVYSVTNTWDDSSRTLFVNSSVYSGESYETPWKIYPRIIDNDFQTIRTFCTKPLRVKHVRNDHLHIRGVAKKFFWPSQSPTTS